MAVLVKDMNMPTNCEECSIKAWEPYYEEYVCPFSGIVCLSVGRQDDCPLKEIQPHGGLIDAMELLKKIAENAYIITHGYNETEYGMSLFGILQAVSEAPRIVNAND